MMSLNLIEMPTWKKERAESVIATLEDMLGRARLGELETVEIVYSCIDGKWGTTASKAVDCRINAAMLMELAMRRLGLNGDSVECEHR